MTNVKHIVIWHAFDRLICWYNPWLYSIDTILLYHNNIGELISKSQETSTDGPVPPPQAAIGKYYSNNSFFEFIIIDTLYLLQTLLQPLGSYQC